MSIVKPLLKFVILYPNKYLSMILYDYRFSITNLTFFQFFKENKISIIINTDHLQFPTLKRIMIPNFYHC